MKDDRIYLQHVAECIKKIEDYTSEGTEVFFDTPLIQDAVMRNLEIIGEAVKNVSIELRNKHPEVSWKGAAGLRDVIIHNYMGIDIHQVWSVVERNLPILKMQIHTLLSELQLTDE